MVAKGKRDLIHKWSLILSPAKNAVNCRNEGSANAWPKKNGDRTESQIVHGKISKFNSIDPASYLSGPFFCWEINLISQDGIIVHTDFMLSSWIVLVQ